MVLTPQLLQAIKLLQMPNAELAAFIEAELERNPLLERADELPVFDPPAAGARRRRRPRRRRPSRATGRPRRSNPTPTRWRAISAPKSTTPSSSTGRRRRPSRARVDEGLGLSATSWTGRGGRGFDEEAPDLEAYVAAPVSFSEHLTRQAMIVAQRSRRPHDRRGADRRARRMPATSPRRSRTIAERLGAPLARVEAVLTALQGLEPTGVFARSLAECLALQLIERDRYDPAMQALIANLPALARRDFAALRRACGVDDDDIADMIAEIRRLDPKPGRAFGAPSSRRRSPTSSSPPRRTIPGGSNSTARRCRACWSTRPTPPRSSAAPAARRTGSSCPRACRPRTG